MHDNPGEFQIWDHEKADDGESRCIARRRPYEVKREFHDLKLGEDRVIGETDYAITTIVRSI